MNRALIDTDILSYYLKGDTDVVRNFEKYLDCYDILEISIITYYEIISGLHAKSAFKQLSVFEEFVSENFVLPLTEESAKLSAEIYANLRQSGKTLDDIDLLIAGIAIENEMILVTNNDNHFGRVPGLQCENWKKNQVLVKHIISEHDQQSIIELFRIHQQFTPTDPQRGMLLRRGEILSYAAQAP
ncbi:type II toxin-antitoxin system VapC family toxin [Alkalitalea saponilacus]|uniref:tRNA(fMet)-specific endonuclease VapC n=1 Tax=Alkalitalea saponilacus TaxID=889453 RepID=A0A1T5H0I3_9BACT|nr:type II toxin-antitoxin system VapC family toxin [Alkalitalea saponilacus]ASB50947.1 VapC toxin family PIN domain ribonuclease [Alkalitalea saponilacus]SKC14213.1 tRNA(fMet)-specific endonuclease VapC [Alkalitalea saponilacus]